MALAVLLFIGQLNGQECNPIEYSTFYDAQAITVPDTLQTGDVECYTITPALGTQSGTIWSNDPIDLNSSFEYSYYVNLGSNNANGADGMVFVLNGDPAGQAAVGENGGSLAYGGAGGISPSVAVEFDTWDNGPTQGDISNDHAMLHYNANMNGSAGAAVDLGNIEDGDYHLVVITWDAIGTVFSVSWEGTEIISVTNDLVANIFGGNSEVLVGFTGSTGGSVNNQRICDVQVVYPEICNGIDDDCDGLIDEDLSSFTPQDITICEGQSYLIGSSAYTEDGVYTDVLVSTAGCDSVVETTLTVSDVITYVHALSVCDGWIHYEGTSEYTVSGTYFDTYSDMAGCDSVIQTELLVLDQVLYENIVAICEGESHTEGTSVYTEAGVYEEVYLSNASCDSTVRTILSVLASSLTELTLELCEGEDLVTPQGNYGAPGFIQEIYTGVNGCDSLVEMNLIALETHEVEQFRMICEGGTFSIGTSTYSEAGTYVDFLQSQLGCDSMVTTHITVIEEFILSDTVICEGQSFVLDMTTFPFHTVSGYSSVSGEFYSFNQAGEKFVSVDLDGCVLSTSFQVNVLPQLYDEKLDLKLCEDEPLQLWGRSLSLDRAWSTGATDSVITVFDPGEYVLEHEYRCGDVQDRFLVEAIKCNCTVFIPTAFSPNEDEVNDFFQPEVDCEFGRYEFYIFGRDGQVLFESFNPEEKWNGGVGRYYVPAGNYPWLLKYSPKEISLGQDVVQRGMVTVIR